MSALTKDEILAKFPLDQYCHDNGIKLFGNGPKRTCRCPLPGHEDKNPSCSVDLSKQLFYCHVCDKGGTVIDMHAYRHGWDPKADFAKAITDLLGETTKENNIVAEYNYNDESGALLYQIVRLTPKSFRIRRKVNGGWVWKKGGVRVVPYHLDEVVRATNEIYIAEGEKDADTLRKLKLVATCNPFGAKKWEPGFAIYFKDRDVIICPDADKDGREHCLQVGENLLPVARGVSVVSLPPGLKDVTDLYEDNRGTFFKRLQQAVSEAKPFADFRHGSNNSGPDFHGPHGGAEAETEIHVEHFAPAPFPLHCFPIVPQTMARAISETALVPDSLSGACVLGILSASLGKGIQVQSGPDRLTRGNLFIVPSALSGTGKSEAFRHAAAPFQSVEEGVFDTWTRYEYPSLQTSKLVLEIEIKHLQEQISKNTKANNPSIVDDLRADLTSKLAELSGVEKKIQAPTLIVEDITIEKLAVLLSCNNETLSSLSPDGGAIINNILGRYSTLKRTEETVYLKGYSGDPCKVDRQSRPPVSLKSPCISALWLIQEDKLNTLFSEKMLTEGGLAPRLLAFHSGAEPQDIPENSTRIDPVIFDAYSRLIKGLTAAYRLPGQPYIVVPAKEASLALRTYHNAIVKKRRGELLDVTIYAARWAEQAWRISVCLHAALHGANAHNHQLVVETAHSAIELSDWFAARQLEILQSKRSNLRLERAQKLLSCVLNYGGSQTVRELARRNKFGGDECRELAREFPGLLRCEMLPTQAQGGRPSEHIIALQRYARH